MDLIILHTLVKFGMAIKSILFQSNLTIPRKLKSKDSITYLIGIQSPLTQQSPPILPTSLLPVIILPISFGIRGQTTSTSATNLMLPSHRSILLQLAQIILLCHLTSTRSHEAARNALTNSILPICRNLSLKLLHARFLLRIDRQGTTESHSHRLESSWICIGRH